MKQQRLFNSFWPSLSAAVLATQPAWAGTLQVTTVRLKPTDTGIQVILEIPKSTSPQVLTSSQGETFIADIVNTQLRNPQDDALRASNPTDSITGVTVTPLNSKSIRVRVTGRAGVPVGKIIQSDRGIVISLKATGTPLGQAQSRIRKNKKLQTTSATSQGQSQNAVEPARRSNLASDNRNSRVAQSSPANSDIRTPQTPPPSYLNPSPNPLFVPTRPEEVRIQGLQPITLEQAYQLARRNNRQLQISELTLENARAALREQQAALYPNLGVGANLTNQGSNVLSNNYQTISGGGFGTTLGTGTGTTVGTGTGATLGTGTGTTLGTGTGTTLGTGTGATLSGGTGSPVAGATGSPVAGATGAATATTNGTVTTAATNNLQLAGTNTGVSPVTTTPVTTTPVTTTPVTTTPVTTNQLGGIRSRNNTSSTGLIGTVRLSYDLYTSGQRKANIRGAEEQLRFYQLDVERQAEQLRLEVATDYYNLQGADSSVQINQSAVRNAQASLRDAQALEQAGVGTRFDVLTSQVQVANTTQDLTRALAQQQVGRRQLATRLSIAQSLNVTAADPVEIAGLWNYSLENSIVLALQNRAELQQYLARRNQAEQLRRSSLATLGPQVTLSANYQFGYDSLFNDTGGQEGIFSDSYSLGAVASLTLFDGGAAKSRAAQQEAQIAIAETNFADQRNLIRFDVEQYYATLQSSLANIQTASVALEQAREALRLARLRFQAGVGIQTDVIDSENRLTLAEGNRVTAILDYNRSLASLQRAISSGQPR